MTTANVILTVICFGLFILAIIGYAVWATKLKMRYWNYTQYLKRRGTYKEWSRKKIVIIFISNGSFIASMLSFFGALAVSFFLPDNLKMEWGRMLFESFFFLSFLAVLATLILYLQVPKDWSNGD
jgi:hypothetical protein